MELRVPGRYLPFVSWLNRPDSPFRVRAARGDRVVLSDDGHLASWTAFDSATAALAADEPNRFVVARTLTRHERALLENNGVGYADAAGHAYLRDGPVLIRIDDPTIRLAGSAPPMPTGIGYAGVRIAQELFEAPRERWTVSRVERAARVSKGRASQVLQLLDDEGLTTRRGVGPAAHRVVRDRAALLDWLAGQPRARTTRPRLGCAVYAEDEDDAARRVGAKLSGAKIGFAVTGSTGARLMAARVVTSGATWIRIDPNIPLVHAAHEIGATPVRAGGNVILVRDTGRVGTVEGQYPTNGHIARRARIYLDLFAEPRGESAAELFRDFVLRERTGPSSSS